MPEEITDQELALDCQLAQEIALAEKIQFEAEYVKWQARREELTYRQELTEHEWQFDGVYSFHKQVTQKSTDKFLHTLQAWHSHDPVKPWTIYLNSVGGAVWPGYAVLDELMFHSRRAGGTHEITVKVRGVAASMAGMILQAADHRLMGPSSQLMIHKGSGGVHGTVDQIVDEAEWLKRSTEQMVDLLVERSDCTRRQIVSKISRRDWWLSAEEAVAWRLADGIG